METRHFNVKALWRNRYRATHARSPMANEDGSVLVLALIMLVLLTLVGTSATNTASIEIQMAGNERSYKQHFYLAEAAAMQAFQWIENLLDPTSDVDIKGSTLRHVDGGGAINDPFNDVVANWVKLSDVDAQYPDLYSLVVHTGVAAGGSLDMAASTSIHSYSVYGQYVPNLGADPTPNTTVDNGRLIIETGYKKRF